jgi:hypothetical protein
MILTWAQKCHSALKCLAYMIIGTEQKNKEASHVLLHYSWTLQKTPLLDAQVWCTTLLHPRYDLQLE